MWLSAFFVLVKMLNYLPRKYTKLTKMYLCSKRLYMGDLLRAIYIEERKGGRNHGYENSSYISS